MREIENPARIRKLIESAIRDISLDLRGITVLTEAASGPFVLTPLIAALAGAEKVVAVTRDSRYGSLQAVTAYAHEWAELFGVTHKIKVTSQRPIVFAPEANLVTNLGFVRPIDEPLITALPRDAAVSLMWEPWEFREQDLDLAACRRLQIPVLGTCETHPRLQTFRYLGMLVVKLLLEADIEVFNSDIILIGSNPFGIHSKEVLEANGARVLHIDPLETWSPLSGELESHIRRADALVLVEHNFNYPLLGGQTGIPLEWLEGTGIKVAHVCGGVDYDGVEALGIKMIPPQRVPHGFMTLTTDYVGPRPVIDLHAAGLRVGADLVHGMRKWGNVAKAVEYALESGFALDFPKEFSK